MRPSPSCSGQLPGKVESQSASSSGARPSVRPRRKPRKRAQPAYKAWSAYSYRGRRWRCTRPVRRRAQKVLARRVSHLNLKAVGGQLGCDGCTSPQPSCSTTCWCSKRSQSSDQSSRSPSLIDSGRAGRRREVIKRNIPPVSQPNHLAKLKTAPTGKLGTKTTVRKAQELTHLLLRDAHRAPDLINLLTSQLVDLLSRGSERCDFFRGNAGRSTCHM